MSKYEPGAKWNFTLPAGPNAGEVRNFVVVEELRATTGRPVDTGVYRKLERVDTGSIAWASTQWLDSSTDGWAQGHSARAVDMRAVSA